MPLTTAEKRQVGEEFIEYLTREDLIRTWHRADLKHYYNIFSEGRKTIPYSQALFVLARFGRRELAVRNGTTVVFRGTEAFQCRRTIQDAQRVTSDYIDIVAISERTNESSVGYFTRVVSDASTQFSWIELELRNKSNRMIQLVDCRVVSRPENFAVEWTKSEIRSLNNHTILLKPQCEGEVRTTELEITLLIGSYHREKFTPYFRFEVHDDEDNDSYQDDFLPSSSVDYPRPGLICESFEGAIPGLKPDSLLENDLEMHWRLPNIKTPIEIRSAWFREALYECTKTGNRAGDAKLREDLSDTLTISNYNQKFKILLHVEELQNRRDIQRYDIDGASLSEEGSLLYLEVPGLAEKRPSVLRRDKVYVKLLNKDGECQKQSYEGHVHHVEQQRVGLGFNQKLRQQHLKNKLYYVRFDFNRLALKLMHRSSNAMFSRTDSQEILFPSDTLCGRDERRRSNRLTLYNRLIEQNAEQRDAVEMIASGNASKVYIIFGPPGTGKTITMVEAIHQVLRKNKETHMLVCAPSNSACDLLTSRLMEHVDTREIFRMHAASRNWNEVPSDVKTVSNHNGDKFYYPAREALMKCRVIVTTLITAGRIASANFPSNHFNFVFIDEAGQAMEPEVMVAVAGVLAEYGRLVLAGDPKQLGPVIRSPLAIENGLELSYLERLMSTIQMYAPVGGNYNNRCVVKLLKNYRSHETIIHVSNELFYENELQVCADEMLRNCMSNWDQLPNTGFPIIFHGVQGEDKREPRSPSFFNMEEVKKVKSYVDALLNSKGRKMELHEIGIITPYRKQVQKLREGLKKLDIKVGSVEEFQGQERRVIIISTVRSNTEHLQFDAKFNLGFLRNPKRFNVAITRAKALMIIIGNPRILYLDKHWRTLLQYCMDNAGYTGIKFSPDEVKIEDNWTTTGDSVYSSPIDDKAIPQWRQDP